MLTLIIDSALLFLGGLVAGFCLGHRIGLKDMLRQFREHQKHSNRDLESAILFEEQILEGKFNLPGGD